MSAPATVRAAGTRTATAAAADRRHVQHVLEQASYFVIFSVPDPQSLSQGKEMLPGLPLTVFQIDITEAPRRMSTHTLPPTPECGLRVGKRVSRKQVADQTLVMQVSPNNWQSGPGRTPWTTLLVPFLSQRFWMFDGNFAFRDGAGTGFRAVAGGRFFPAGGSSVWIGGVADMLEGLGTLKGFTGNLAINGLTTPPSEFANAFLFRFVDPTGALKAESLSPVEAEEPNPDYSDSALIPLVAEPDPRYGLEVEDVPGSSEKRFHIVERLRMAQTNFDVRVPGFLKSETVVGEVVGERRTTLVFDPDFAGGDPPGTIAMSSIDSQFAFYAGGDKPIGTLVLDLAEARAFRTEQAGLANPFYRIVGFGTPGRGTGQFAGLEKQGMLSLNGALSLEPYALSSMYLLRIRDPQGRFRAAWQGAL